MLTLFRGLFGISFEVESTLINICSPGICSSCLESLAVVWLVWSLLIKLGTVS